MKLAENWSESSFVVITTEEKQPPEPSSFVLVVILVLLLQFADTAHASIQTSHTLMTKQVRSADGSSGAASD
jgi:hypothetical protein